MMRRSPARFFAPIALVAVVVALFMIVSAGSSSDEEPVGDGGKTTTSTTSTTEKKTTSTSSGKKGRRTYTVQAGDTPSGIAEKTGVSLEQILDLNPDIESDALAPGTKLKLR